MPFPGQDLFFPRGQELDTKDGEHWRKAGYEAYNANFVIKDYTYASGAGLLPGFKQKGSNVLTLWKKGTSFGWNLNGSKKGPFTLPAEFNANVYVHFNINGPMASEQAIVIKRIRITGPKDSAVSW